MPDSLIGRGRSAGVIRAEVDRVLDGRGGLVFVTGEAGIGKTSLVAEAADDAARRGARVLSASCWEGGGAPGYWPWVQVVRDLARTATTAEWSAAAATAGDSLPVLLGEAAPPPAAARPDSDNVAFRLHDAFTTLLVDAARAKPTVVVLDDLHWADPASLRLLDFLSRHAWFEPLLVLGAYRDVEVERRGHPAGALLPPLASRARTVDLAGLDAAEVGVLIERVTGTAPEAGLVAEVHRRTGGNPFFVEQTAQLGSPVGAGARDAVRRRLDLLPPEVVAVLATASAIGHEFTEGLLAAVRAAGPPAGDPGETAALLEPALAARLVSRADGGRYTFTHDLVREFLYDGLGVEGRREAHLAVVRANASRPELSPAALARHGRLAVPLLPGREAADLLLAAARYACDRLASEESVGHYREALRIAGDSPDRPWRELELAEQLDRAGDLPGARETFAAVLDAGRGLDNTALVARAALGLHRLGNPAHRTDDQIALMDEARAGLERAPGSGDASLRARVLAAAGMARAHRGVDRDTAQELSRAAVALAREAGDDATLGWCLLALHDAIWAPGADADRIAVLDELTAAARRAADGELESLASFLRALALLEQGSPRGRDELAAFTALTERTRLPRHRYLAVSRRGALAAMEGRFAEARTVMDEARVFGERVGEVDGPRVWRDQVWILELLRGETAQALGVARSATPGEPFIAALEGLTAAYAGDAETAARHFPEAERLLEALPPRFAPMLMVYRARLAALTGDPDLCERARRALKPVADRWAVFSGGMVLGPMSLWIGDVNATQGFWNDAVADFTAAADAADRLGARPWAVLARIRLAAALRARGDTDRAAAVSAEATAEAARIGMALEQPTAEAPADAAHVFRPDGPVWTLGFAGRTVHVRDAKGLHDLRILLGRPGADVPATELLSPAAARETAGPGAFGADPVLDEQARNAYRDRLLRLDEALARAEARGDERGATALDEERQALIEELRRATGLGGRPRRLGDDAERARQTVTARIRDVLRKLRESHPELHAHLTAAVVTGAHCSYRPEAPTRWSL
ncbi:AAA family ATPase [Glycomyces sp. A-F 0318]|uniref:ATP-binding protein n=1 Tax=Glycomyces amatae TaxID=2881355 RepID=UPI001E3434F0|nr:AAA family ATPase [Glycomyces amatae]MCD0447443.1 AAA family ATPase [Glycomyces amatae]